MEIKELNEKLGDALKEEQIEYDYDFICDIEPVLKELKQDEIKNWKEQVNVEKAVEKLHEYYKQNKVSVGFPTNTGFKYKEATYHLAIVIGNVVRIKNNKLFCKYGYKHIFDRHGKETHIIDGGTLATEENLKKAISNIENAIDEGTPFISKEDPERLAILHGEFLYIICFSNNPKYVTYLHNLFPPKKSYLKKDFKRMYTKTSPVELVKTTKDDSEKSS